MNLETLINDKNLKPKEKTEQISQWILSHPQQIDTLIDFAKQAKDTIKATCMEAVELCTKTQPDLATDAWFSFATDSLSEKAPRLKWESARVIGNTAAKFPKKLNLAIENLLPNTKHEGTVVRWSTAYALSEILKLKTEHNKKLLPIIQKIAEEEEKNSIKKIYLSALKKCETLK